MEKTSAPVTMLLNHRHLYFALQIKRYSTLSEAARHVHITQSALTQSIKKLESNLSEPLFQRSATGMFTTPQGDVFLNRFSRALRYLETFSNTLFSHDKPARVAFLRGITSRQLSALISVVEQQSYTAAALVSGLTQPTLHRTIRELEALCNQPLFTRAPAGVEATWRARQLSRVAGLYFSELEQGIDELAQLHGEQSGSVKIGSLPLARTRIVPQSVLSLLAQAPQAKVSITDGPYDEQLHALLHGQIDVLVGALRMPSLSPDIEQFALFDDTLSLVYRQGHHLEAKTAFNKADWLALKWIAPKRGTPARKVFEQLFIEMGLTPPKDVIECSSLVASRAILINSDRVTLLPARQVEVDVEAGLLAVSPVALNDPPRQIGYALRKGWSPTKLQAEFIEILQQTAARGSPTVLN